MPVLVQVDVHGNGVYENRENGVLIRGRGDVNFNDVFCNRKSALSFAANAHLKVKPSNIHSM